MAILLRAHPNISTYYQIKVFSKFFGHSSPSEPRVSPPSTSNQQSLIRKTEESVAFFGSTNFFIHLIGSFQWPSHCERCPNSRPFPESPNHYKRRHHNYY
ncbi:hypothetical protein AVEN_9626-1 [Araneus ventricosus]|uniref:Uncharacterized protein n=1 Tax=Araneus ventricosus TaxID=182803 RepID=A0A4Y2EUZ9_ARAVE|nr:hypothetical protein AVEN_9626-1 [Araneus ventricosus]